MTRLTAVVVAVCAASMLATVEAERRQETAVISGTVVSGAQPLRRAIVTVAGAGLTLPRSAITGDDGQFVIDGLPAGQLTVTATKRGYLTTAADAGVPVIVAAGERRVVRVELPRGGVITGVVRDVNGRPISSVRVFAIDADRPVAPGPTGGDPGVLTDDRGVYRLFELPARQYLVFAVPVHSAIGEITRHSDAEVDAIFARLAARRGTPAAARSQQTSEPPSSNASLAAVFHPGTSVMAEAVRVPVAAGDVRDGVDIVMQPVPVTTIDGLVVGEAVTPAAVEMSITVASGVRLFALGSLNPQLVQRPAADGRFRYASIAPGRYVLRARAGGVEPSFAIAEVDVFGQPVNGVVLSLRRGSRFSGRVVVGGSSGSPRPDLSRARVWLAPTDSGGGIVAGTIVGSTFASERSSDVRPDGTFEITGLAPARYLVQIALPGSAGERWSVDTVNIDGRALDGATVEIVSGVDVTTAAIAIKRLN